MTAIRSLIVTVAIIFVSIANASAEELNYIALASGCEKLRELSDETACKQAVRRLVTADNLIARAKTPQAIAIMSGAFESEKKDFIEKYRGVWVTSQN